MKIGQVLGTHSGGGGGGFHWYREVWAAKFPRFCVSFNLILLNIMLCVTIDINECLLMLARSNY